MLALKYSTCQDKVEEDLEVVGAAGVTSKVNGRQFKVGSKRLLKIRAWKEDAPWQTCQEPEEVRQVQNQR
jgi:hypothetical protein